jgi:crotonobetainyl-CoA:carnitine CoA-transferase CaiB-like acyl-CoA transferase
MRRPLTYSYAARDGKLIQLMVLNPQPRWTAFCKALGIEAIENDPRFASDDARNANGEALIPILEATFVKRDFAEWLPLLESLDIPWELISSIEDVTNDPQVHANGIMRKMTVGDTEVSIVAGPASWDGSQFCAEPASAPVLGADTTALLAEVGYSADAIADMQKRSVAN